MKAKLIKPYSNARNYSGKKELTNSYQLIVSTSDGPKEVIDARCWMGRSNQSSVVYAAIWVTGKGQCYSGRGIARGYGYHKASAAIDEAIYSAGIKLSNSISGVGDGAIERAFRAIANLQLVARVTRRKRSGQLSAVFETVLDTRINKIENLDR